MNKPVSDAVILMAGTGSRLRRGGANSPKPLVSLNGRPLISYILEALSKAGIERIHAVIGFEGSSLREGITPLIPPDMSFFWIENREWQKQNGISLLAAATSVDAPFILTMGDHIFEYSMLDLLLKSSDANHLNLAVDRKIDCVFDLDDAMKVQTRADRVVAIGKNLEVYDAIDTGLFVCSTEIFAYLEKTKRNGDCSLADGVRLMATDGKVRAIDIGPAWWQDVDSAETLEHARQLIATRNNG